MNLFRNIPLCFQVLFVNKDKHGKKWLAENSIANGHQIRSSIVHLWEYTDYDINTPPPPPPLYPGSLQFSPRVCSEVAYTRAEIVISPLGKLNLKLLS